MKGRPYPYHPAFDALRSVLWESDYRDADGNSYAVRFTVIDAMGHRTSEVYDFCRFHRGKVAPLQDKNTRQNTPRKWSTIDTYPGTNIKIPGGVQLFHADVNHYKDELSTRLQIASMDPGAWHLHSETSRNWAAQLCAEYLDETKNTWTCPDNAANHAWDCGVYLLAVVDEFGIKFLEKGKSWAQQKKQKGGKGLAKGGLRTKPEWFRNR